MKHLKRFLIENLTLILYVLFVFLIEMIGSVITGGGFYIKDPRYLLCYCFVVVFLMYIVKNQKLRVSVLSTFLYIQATINIIFYLIYKMTGQWFDYSMFSLRNDAMGIIENVPINFWHFYGLITGISLYLVFGLKFASYVESKNYRYKESMIYVTDGVCALMSILLLGLSFLTASSINGVSVDKYNSLLYSNQTSKYNEYGMTNNFINEVYAGTLFSKTTLEEDSAIDNFFYKKTYTGRTKYSGISKGNNVITILGETLEWFSFMSQSAAEENVGLTLPNGITLSEEECRELYPNLWNFYDNSYVMSNYHAREKTDISENYSILGSYPIDSYINYDYYENTLPQSMPNMLRTAYGDNYQAYYFHDGYASFYNRKESIIGLGFDKCYTSEDILKLDNGYIDYGSLGERNLDSQMITSCADLMFPTDKKFYTYITTITTHGMFSKKRENLELMGYYDKLREYGIDIDDEDITTGEFIYYSYLACALETDRAIGVILNELEQRNLLDNTTIVLFGDHNAYYETLTNYVKDINSANDAIDKDLNYMDLYKVPMMIYDTKLYNAVTNNGENKEARFNNKFSSSCDIVPTLLDMLGINYYSNMYYGNSAFTNTESLVYSRAYGYFLSNDAYFYNLNKFYYLNPNLTKEQTEVYLELLKIQGEELIEKIRYIDNMFIKDYFKDNDTLEKYQTKIKELNDF